jgi:predicted RNase H-like nuclease
MWRTDGATAVTSRADEYRAKAREAEQLAEQIRDPGIKEQFLKIAQQWRDMAAYEEKRSR